MKDLQIAINNRLPRKRHAPTLLSTALGDYQCTCSFAEQFLSGQPSLGNGYVDSEHSNCLPNIIYTNYLYKLSLKDTDAAACYHPWHILRTQVSTCQAPHSTLWSQLSGSHRGSPSSPLASRNSYGTGSNSKTSI